MTKDPIELDHRVDAEGDAAVHRLTLRLPEGFVFFEGHFRGLPVLPAAAQLEALVLPAVERVLGDELGPLKRAVRLKFLKPVKPGDELVLMLRRKGADRVAFEMLRGGEGVASGVLTFEVR